MRLKSKPAGSDYDRAVCAASRCSESSAIIDASKARWKYPVPLCSRHWTEATELPLQTEAPEPGCRLVVSRLKGA